VPAVPGFALFAPCPTSDPRHLYETVKVTTATYATAHHAGGLRQQWKVTR
jgi:hypothetical protein